ncbi:unnamed protein product [Brachionus calyciflorus]|uniref:Uncharacterized protein n=1 Tax=Brachionus calyciflorus TaxID=104777 RepID=A0A814F5K1_9BILA|nr:unnamed protein product [Brachionus calyciflorus]
MNQIRFEICEYYSNLIYEIDIKTENFICQLKKQEFEIQINSDRDKIISKIREIKRIKLNNLKDSDSIYQNLFCFFFPAIEDHFQRDYGDNLNFYKRIGQLVVINYTLDENTINKLKDRNCHFHYGESIETIIFSQLIKAKTDELIIDLTKIENNQIRKLDVNKSGNEPNEETFKFSNRYLNVESVNILKIRNYSRIFDQLENNIFEPFKHLNKLILNMRYVKSLNENVFNGMENLEILKLYNFKDLNFESNAFNKLVNLKELVFDRVRIDNPNIFNNLEKLKKLDFNECSVSNFGFNSFNGLKSLESLKVFRSHLSDFFNGDFVSLPNSVKCLETRYFDASSLKINPSLEILNIGHATLDIFANLKMLKFLKVEFIQVNDIVLLNELSQLEYLDLTLKENLEEFNLVNFSMLKFLVLTCDKIPKFNGSLKNLQGLELINAKIIPNDAFDNFVNLDYLALIDPEENMFDKFISTEFESIKNLKYFKLESHTFEIVDDELEKIKKALVNFFEYNNKKISGLINDFSIEVMAKLKDGDVNEKVYFEKYLQVSECVREFIFNVESDYFRKDKRNFNFEFDTEEIDFNDDYDNYSDDYSNDGVWLENNESENADYDENDI